MVCRNLLEKHKAILNFIYDCNHEKRVLMGFFRPFEIFVYFDCRYECLFKNEILQSYSNSK